ncbi:MAG: hypothetical protein ABI601_16050 [bacterium]
MLLTALLVLPDVGQVDAFAEPWRRLYSHSTLVSTLVLFGHIGGLLAGGGLALAADRATLRVDVSDEGERARHLDDLARLRPPVATAFIIAGATGALLFFADVEAFATSRIFWAKMALIVLLMANVGLMVRVEAALRAGPIQGVLESSSAARERLWRRRRGSAAVSAVLWFVLVLAGTALASH